jgi:hypothetical protein
MAIITIDKSDKIHVSDSWNQYSISDLLYMVRNLIFNENKLEFGLWMFFWVTGIKLVQKPNINKKEGYFVRYKNHARLITAQQAAFAAQTFNKLLDRCDLNRQRMPRLRAGWRFYYGPNDRLFNLRWEEYEAAERQWERYTETKEQKYLYRLAAVLYRPPHWLKWLRLKKKNGDIRKAFNSHDVDVRARRMMNVSLDRLMLIYYFFEGSRLFITQTFAECFGKNLGAVRKKSITLVDALAQGNLIDYNKVRNAFLYDAMNNMNQATINHNDLKKQMKSKNK